MDLPPEGFAKGSVIVADQILWDAVPWKRLSDLPRQPLRRGVCRHADPTDFSSTNAKHDECKQTLEGQRWHDQKVYSRNAIRVIAQEGLPALRGRSSSSQYVL